MRIFVFGQTDKMAQEYFEAKGRTNFLNIKDSGAQTVEVLVNVNQLPRYVIPDVINPPQWCSKEDVVVHLVGDWELNPIWPETLRRLRCLANVCVVKMFVARDS